MRITLESLKHHKNFTLGYIVYHLISSPVYPKNMATTDLYLAIFIWRQMFMCCLYKARKQLLPKANVGSIFDDTIQQVNMQAEVNGSSENVTTEELEREF